MIKIALLSAIPQERRPIQRQLGNSTQGQIKDIPIWSFVSSNQKVLLAETGIGSKRAEEAAKHIIEFMSPDIVINTGFCGALTTGLRLGDIVLAESVLAYSTELHALPDAVDKTLFNLLSASVNQVFYPATFISTTGIESKWRIAALLNDKILRPVLEMESYAIAAVCHNNDIPFVSIRAVSDTADQDPQPVCSKIFGSDLKISIIKLLKALITSPLISRDLVQLSANTEVAGKYLAIAIKRTLETL